MRGRRWIFLSSVLLGACQPMVDAQAFVADEFESTYTTWVRIDLPSPAGEGDAPLAGSLGPPEHMVEPEMMGTATMTREGSSGPPRRAEGPVEPIEGMGQRRYLKGHDPDAH
ncbi:MAG: hypothetical protein Q8P18_28965 [Pseudomonadota bacterium]|nr:hypothetical protein [Pseudomonadota bacterium]